MNSNLLQISGIEPSSIVDGHGFRYAIFVQGCPHHCPGCHNPQTHPFTGGEEVKIEDLFEEILKNPLLKGVTFSGGEPFCQPEPLLELARMIKEKTKLDITVYTGYTYEKLLESEDDAILNLLSLTDFLIDGLYIEELRDLTLTFRGSSNQRVIDLNETRKAGEIVIDHCDIE